MSVSDPDGDLARWRRLPRRAVDEACLDALILAGWLDGRCDRGARERVERHLAGCAACVAAVRDLRVALAAARPLAPSAAAPAPWGLGRRLALAAGLLLTASGGLLLGAATVVTGASALASARPLPPLTLTLPRYSPETTP
ncbi:MAG TPA: zf-HC2 domain-containing protein [Planctomycetota bacterium]|nr:zf-HC2 domain-containing protein [Planctomycetota bacterium]